MNKPSSNKNAPKLAKYAGHLFLFFAAGFLIALVISTLNTIHFKNKSPSEKGSPGDSLRRV